MWLERVLLFVAVILCASEACQPRRDAGCLRLCLWSQLPEQCDLLAGKGISNLVSYPREVFQEYVKVILCRQM